VTPPCTRSQPPASPASGADPAAKATGCPPWSASPTFQPPPGSRQACARYGKTATVHLTAITCLWYHVHRARPVQVVLAREHGHTAGFDLALVSTDLDATPAELVERYSARWAIEVSQAHCPHTGRGRCLCGARVA
jgi:hypothetical protein